MADRVTGSSRILIVDDHAVVRRWVRSVLEGHDEFEVVGEASTVGEALRAVGASHTDVVIVDLRIPGGDGVQLIREILSRHEHARCLVLSSFSDTETVYHAVMAGAAGHITKDAAPAEFLSALRTVASGGQFLRLDLLEDTERTRRHGSARDLTDHEERVVDLIARGLSNREIASELGLSERVVRNDVWRIHGKLQQDGGAGAARVFAGRAHILRGRTSVLAVPSGNAAQRDTRGGRDPVGRPRTTG